MPRRTIGLMSQAPDPERIFAARKAAGLERLVRDHGILRGHAIAWLESYEGGAADLHDLRRDPAFRENGHQFARQEHNAGHRPPPDVSSQATVGTRACDDRRAAARSKE